MQPQNGLTALYSTIASICASLIVLGASAVMAQDSEIQAVDAAVACLEIKAADDRLACLEGAARVLKATRITRESESTPELADSRDSVVETQESEPQEVILAGEEEKTFGDEYLPEVKQERRKKEKLQKLQAQIVELKVNSVGDITAYLDNGQVWRQLKSDSRHIMVPHREMLFTATIKRSFMGGYNMRIDQLGQTIRVKRIK